MRPSAVRRWKEVKEKVSPKLKATEAEKPPTLNERYNITADEYERTVGDLTFAHNVARDYFNDSFICGWGGDYGDRAVHIKTGIPRLRFEDKDHPTRSRIRHKKWKDESRLGRSGPR